LSLIFYLVRSKQDKGLFYSNATKCNGWVSDIRKASIWGTKNGPCQIVKILGDTFSEIISMEGVLRVGDYKSIYLIRHKVTGEYVANKTRRRKGIMLTNKFSAAGTWTCLSHPKTLIRSRAIYYDVRFRLNPDELEIIRMPVFLPRIKDE